jgi:hypothetical protein
VQQLIIESFDAAGLSKDLLELC